MIEFISQPWPWYISGLAISLIMFLLYINGGRFGVSSTLDTICAAGGAGKKYPIFDFDWKDRAWNLVFILGAIIGGSIANHFLNTEQTINISAAAINSLDDLGVPFDGELAPLSIFNWQSLFTIKGLLIICLGGFLVGFGARWAGGCTSGHAISGLSNFQIASLVAVIGFFIGGLIMVHIIFPLIF